MSEAKEVACLLYGPGDARYEEHPVPKLSDPFDVLVRIHYVGVCGSDVRDFAFIKLKRIPSI